MPGRTDLDRNMTDDGSCKYALIRLDKLRLDAENDSNPNCVEAATILEFLLNKGRLSSESARVLREYIELGRPGDSEECFVLKLKDQNAAFALEQYANSARTYGMPEFADRVLELADRSRKMATKRPD